MNLVILATLFIVMCAESLVNFLQLPPFLRFLPEASSVVLMVYVIFAGTRDRFRLVAPKYWISFAALVVVMLCGILNNPVGAGPMLSGARFFLRAVPLFFLPAVLPIGERQLRRQLQWLLALALLQVPIAIYQRWVILDQERYSGDAVQGTLLDSGILSMFEICAVLVLTGLLLKGRVSKLMYAILFLALLIPNTIDETKATIFLLPLGLMVTLLVGAEPRRRLQYALTGVAALAVFGALFVPIYNRMEEFNPFKSEKDITNFFTNERAFDRYMNTGVGGLGTKRDVRRGDAISVPIEFLARDPVTLAFGLGVGSVAPSSLGKNFEGPYFLLFQKFLITTFTIMLLQIGVFGLLIVAYLFWLVFWDSLKVARRDDTLVGAIAAGWPGVVALFLVGTLYNLYLQFNSVTFLYAYFAGLICARSAAMAAKA